MFFTTLSILIIFLLDYSGRHSRQRGTIIPLEDRLRSLTVLLYYVPNYTRSKRTGGVIIFFGRIKINWNRIGMTLPSDCFLVVRLLQTENETPKELTFGV